MNRIFIGQSVRGLHRFTLIEMLVVVAIIAILASLLVPALQTAVLTARSTLCYSNLRQLNIGMVEYTSTNASWFPSTFTWPFRDAPAGFEATKTAHGLPYYLGTDADVTPVIRGCPDSTGYALKITYALNDRLGGIYQWPPLPPTRKLNTLRTPEDVICLIDSVDAQNNDRQCTATKTRFGTERHARRPNILWADGHIAPEYTDLITNSVLWNAATK